MEEFRAICKDMLKPGRHFNHERQADVYTVRGLYSLGNVCKTTEQVIRWKDLNAFLSSRPQHDWKVADGSGSAKGKEDEDDNDNSSEGVLRLVEISTSGDDALEVEPRLFCHLFEAPMNFDYSAAWLIIHNYYGFHHFPGNRCDTFYFGWAWYSIAWSFDYESLSTYMCFIKRREACSVDEVFGPYKVHASYLCSPTFVTYCLSLSICARFDSHESESDWWRVKQIEHATGYSWSGTPVMANPGLDRLKQWLQATGEIVITTSARRRTLRSVALMLDHVEGAMNCVENGVVKDEVRAMLKDSTQRLIAAVPIMRSKISAYDEYMDYMTIRVERLSAVLFSLFTHKDAESSIEQAHASRELAEAAKRDSSAMKTIAVMTMAFLPATFFAALFAMPTLDWNSEGGNVIQSNHWIYWAFTLPATLLVFLIWLLLDNRH